MCMCVCDCDCVCVCVCVCGRVWVGVWVSRIPQQGKLFVYICTIEYVSDTVIEKADVTNQVRRVIVEVTLAVTLTATVG